MGKSGSSLAIGTTPGTAFDGGQGAAAQQAITATSTALSNFETVVSASQVNLVTVGKVPLFGTFPTSSFPGLEANVPLYFWNASTSAPQLAVVEVIKDETNTTGSTNTSAVNVQDTVGVGEGGQQAGIQVLLTCPSGVAQDNCVGANVIASREIGSIARLWAAVWVSRDRSGVDSATSGGAQLNFEQDISADLADDGLNTTVYGGVGDRFMDQWVFGIAAPNSIMIQAQIVGTAMTLNTAATLPAGTVLHGAPTALAANTTVVSGSGTSYVVTPSQNVTGEQMSATPPSPTSASFAGGLVVGVGAGTSVDSLILASLGSAGTGSQIANMLDARNVVAPTGSGLTYPRAVIMPSNTQIEWDGDGANTVDAGTPSLLSPPERTTSYSSADGAWEYTIRGVVAFADTDAGLFKTNFGLTNQGAFTEVGNSTFSGNLTIGGWEANTVSPSVAAAGTTLSTATVLASSNNKVSSGASGAGVSLPAAAPVGTDLWVFNRTGNPIKIWPDSSSDTIESGTAGAAVTAPIGGDEHFVRDTSTDWLQ